LTSAHPHFKDDPARVAPTALNCAPRELRQHRQGAVQNGGSRASTCVRKVT